MITGADYYRSATTFEEYRADSNALKRYWLSKEGLAKWAASPHPWTALYNQLRKHMNNEMAKRVASQWFHDHFGYWPGDRGGKNPVGKG